MELALSLQRKDNVDIRLNLYWFILYSRWFILPQTNGIDGSHRQKGRTGEYFHLPHGTANANNYPEFYSAFHALLAGKWRICGLNAVLQLFTHHFSPHMNSARRMLVSYRPCLRYPSCRRTAAKHACDTYNAKNASRFPKKHVVSLLGDFARLLEFNNTFSKVSSSAWAETSIKGQRPPVTTRPFKFS